MKQTCKMDSPAITATPLPKRSKTEDAECDTEMDMPQGPITLEPEHFNVATPGRQRSPTISPTQPFNITEEISATLPPLNATRRIQELFQRQLQEAARENLRRQQSELVEAMAKAQQEQRDALPAALQPDLSDQEQLKLLTIQFQELQKNYENLRSKLVQPEVAEDPDQVELQEWLKETNAQIDETYRTQRKVAGPKDST